MNACASWAISAVAVRPVPIAQTGSYGEYQVLGVGDALGDRGNLPAKHRLGLPRLALRLRLADAGDDVEAVLDRRVRPSCGGRVGLAEVLASLGVADDRAVHPELPEHRRGHLAGEGALVGPVDVLRGDGDLCPGERADRLAE